MSLCRSWMILKHASRLSDDFHYSKRRVVAISGCTWDESERCSSLALCLNYELDCWMKHATQQETSVIPPRSRENYGTAWTHSQNM